MKRYVTEASLIGCLAMLLLGAAGDAHAAKEKFVRTKPHVNVSGPHSLSNETLSVAVGVVEPGTIGGALPAQKPCAGEVDLRIEDAGTGASLASRTGIALASGTFQSLSHSSPSASISVRVVIVARNMLVDGKECVLRGEMEFQDIASGQVSRRIPIRRIDFVKAK